MKIEIRVKNMLHSQKFLDCLLSLQLTFTDDGIDGALVKG